MGDDPPTFLVTHGYDEHEKKLTPQFRVADLSLFARSDYLTIIRTHQMIGDSFAIHPEVADTLAIGDTITFDDYLAALPDSATEEELDAVAYDYSSLRTYCLAENTRVTMGIVDAQEQVCPSCESPAHWLNRQGRVDGPTSPVRFECNKCDAAFETALVRVI
ncbi:hypothetical protein [Halomarina oriensis]|uniref:Uncharacterized protein n=1 Tax=Halomarina oriensis TaxID=671145 RepID=A0A6B0GV55_9EURY|nr:hypothetical protein [Halomarina oriensis]MWG36463.1 hypothetical protein [Halomarina oriensis]